MMGYWFGGMGLWMALLGILFWGGLIWLIVWGVNKATEQRNPTVSSNSPLEIVRGRYARSEITKEQYEQIRKDLS